MKERAMIELHPEILKKNGKNEFVVLPYEEFEAIRALLEDAEDVLELRKARAEEGDAPTLGLDEVRRELGLAQE